MDYHEALNRLFNVHSTAFYLKATTCAQIKAAYCAELRLPWSEIFGAIEALKTFVRHEQFFVARIKSDKSILSKIDTETSMTMWSKLAYQLTKLCR